MLHEKGVAVVVTYNRKNELQKCIQCLLNQTYKLNVIYIVDNASTDGTNELLKDYANKYSSIRVITENENLGGSAGFSHGIQVAYSEGADWIWGMDDDAFANRDALEILLKYREKIGSECAYWSNATTDREFLAEYKEVKEWMFVGFFLPRFIIDKIGFPRSDFFIYYDDVEYADRIINTGYKIYKIRDSKIIHKDAVSNVHIFRMPFKQKIEVINLPLPKWKSYYLIRNRILRYHRGDIKRKKAIMAAFRKLLIAALRSPSHCRYVAIGLYHGIIGKSGKWIEP